jgi:hypothetical protein
MEPRNRFQGMNSASLCNLAGRYDNPIPPQFLAPIDPLKIPALVFTLRFFLNLNLAVHIFDSTPLFMLCILCSGTVCLDKTSNSSLPEKKFSPTGTLLTIYHLCIPQKAVAKPHF